MRPSIMLLLRALLVMGAILAVMSCKNPVSPDSGVPPRRPRVAPAAPIVLVGASDIATCSSPGTAATAALLDAIPGGRWLEPLIRPAANVEVRNNTTFGVIKFTLNAGNYSWQFVPAAGGTFTDSGTGTCH